VDRTFICDLEQLRSLFRRQFASKVNIPLDAIQHSLFGFALGAIQGVDLRVPQIDRKFLERPCFPASVHPNRNRSAGPQSGKEKIIGRRSGVRATHRQRLIGNHPMLAGKYFLRKPSGTAADNHTSYVTLFSFAVHFLMCVGHVSSCSPLVPITGIVS
jgi:hypothetical protein